MCGFPIRPGLVFLSSCLSLLSSAQRTDGLTGRRDTSYSNQSALRSTKRTHPDIQLAGPYPSKSVREDTGLRYCTVGERKLAMDVFRPANKQKRGRPAVMIIHGGGWRSGDRSQHHALAQRLAARGWVCFTPEYRLSTEALYPAAVHDLKAALRFIRARAQSFGVDTGRVAVLGFSAGGALAAFLGVTSGMPRFEGTQCPGGGSSRVQAVIDLDGTLSFVHPQSGEGDDSRSTSAATYWFGHAKKDNPALWEEASPLRHAGPQTPPTLFINSAVDRMHAGRDDYMEILRRHGIYTEVRNFAGAPHSFPLFHPWFEPMVGYIDAFLNKVFYKK